MINIEILDEVFALDDEIPYIVIIDSKGSVIANRIRKDVENEDEYELLRIDLYIVKQVLGLYDGSFGKTISAHVRRKKISQLLFYHDYITIYVACKPNISQSGIHKISNKVDHIFSKQTDETISP